MTLWRRIAPSLVLASLLTALLGAGAAFAVTVPVVVERVGDQLIVLFRWMRDDDFAGRCRAAPDGWSVTLPRGARMRTFDAARLPAADGPDPALLGDVLAGDEVVGRILARDAPGGVLLLRLAPAGPCSLVEVGWRVDRADRLATVPWALAAAVGVAVVTGILSAGIVVRPIISRVQRLGAAARRVGDDAGYRSAADALDDELGGLSAALDGANARIAATTAALRERNERLQVHLADIAHDLKTPLTAVQLTLEQAARADLRAETREMVARGLDDCVYLAAMIDNLRVGTQLHDGLDPAADDARADLRDLVAQVVRRLERLAAYKGMELAMAGPDAEAWCACRPLVLERVIDNLVYNAVRHGRPGGHVAVLLEAVLLESGGGRFTLTVLDDGPGVAPEELSTLAERTFRGAEARARAPRGTGLGLAIVAEVCRRCGWALAFGHEAPHGLRVTIDGALVGAAG